MARPVLDPRGILVDPETGIVLDEHPVDDSPRVFPEDWEGHAALPEWVELVYREDLKEVGV